MIHRRQFSGALLSALAATSSFATPGAKSDITRQLADIEQASGGRLGVCLLDTAAGARVGHRADERFPMCSTFKFLAASAVLARVDKGQESLQRRIVFGAGDLVTYSPATQKRVGGAGMTLGELCEAAMTLSDNTAANLVLGSLGGPQGITRHARSLGDVHTRLDRFETALNEARPGDPRDTTTPAAMLEDMRKLLLGDALSPASRAQLQQWMEANTTGGPRLRAGVPKDWVVGDRTGSGERGTSNVIAILRPPGRAPILATAYLTGTSATADARNATLASVGAAIAAST